MKHYVLVLLSPLFITGCHSFAGYEPVSASTTGVDGAISLDLGLGSERGQAADAAVHVDRSPDAVTPAPDARADVVRDTSSPPDDASVDAALDAPDDAAEDASDDGSLDGFASSPDTTWDSLVDGATVYSDAYLACRDAQTRLDLYLSIYQGCTVTADCAFPYTPPCGCVIFLNTDPKSLNSLRTYERDVLNACYPPPIGCPLIYCGSAQAKCADQWCIASYTP